MKCIKYLIANNFSDDRTRCIQGVMNYIWTEEDGISDIRTELVEDAVDELINLGYEPHQITGSLISKSTDDMLKINNPPPIRVNDIRRQEVINEYLPIDSRVERWSMAV